MKKRFFISKVITIISAFLVITIAYSGTPLWTFQPLTDTKISVDIHGTEIIKYQVTNQSKKTHELVMKPIKGISQQVNAGNCSKLFTLQYKQSCTLALEVNGSALGGNVFGGPVLCQSGDPLQCYQPSAANILNITLVVEPNLNLTAIPSANTEVGVNYFQANTANGGKPPYTHSVSSGALPLGTLLDTSTGTVSGIPTIAGPFSYTIKVTDQNGQKATASSSGTIVGVVNLTATASANMEVGVTYSQINTVSGGTSPYTYSLFSGVLPAGTSLNTSTGTVSGTPTTAGPFSYTIQVTDQNGQKATAPSSGTIVGIVNLTATASANTQVGVTYSQINTVSGGRSPYTYSIFSGVLPAGTSLNTATGTVSGTPTTAGLFSYTILVTDHDGAAATAPSSGTISSYPIFAYVTNQGNNTVSICPVNYTAAGASLGTCTATTGNGTFNQPSFIAINSSGTIAYVTNSSQFSPAPAIGSVSICPINNDGSFGTCTVSNDPSFLNPVGIAINSSNTYAYVAINFYQPPFTDIVFGVSVCSINNSGLFGVCNFISTNYPTPYPVQFLQGISLNKTETSLYIPDASSSIFMCPITDGGASIGACVLAGGSDVCNPNGFSFNSAGTHAYITEGGCSENNVYICPINNDGTLGSCIDPTINSPTDGNGTFNFTGNSSSNPFTMSSQGFAFIPNNGAMSTMSICPINADSSLGTCVPTAGNDQFGNSTFNLASCVALYPQ